MHMHCRQTLFATCILQLTASKERSKRKAFADIERSGHSKTKNTQCPCRARSAQAQLFLRRRDCRFSKQSLLRSLRSLRLLSSAPKKATATTVVFFCIIKPSDSLMVRRALSQQRVLVQEFWCRGYYVDSVMEFTS